MIRERTWIAVVVAFAAASTGMHAAKRSPERTVVERYDNGQIKRTATLHGDVLDGPVRGYYESGAREYERTYRNGREEGDHRGWYESGREKFEYSYRDGLSEGVQRQWYPTGQSLTLFHHHAGHEVGQQQMWNGDGTIRSNYVIKDGKRFGLIGAMGCTGKGAAVAATM